MADSLTYWIAAAVLGALIGGVGGIVSRYERAPFSVLLTLPALVYILFNALASIFALALIYAFDWIPEGVNPSANIEWIRAIVAGVGGVLLFRATLIVGSSKRAMGLGLSQFLESVLFATGREMDRQDKRVSAKKVQHIMKDVSFEKAYESLALYCLSLIEAPRMKSQQLGKKVKFIHAQQMNNQQKTTLLGIALIEIVGEDLLRKAVDDLEDQIKDTPSKTATPMKSRRKI